VHSLIFHERRQTSPAFRTGDLTKAGNTRDGNEDEIVCRDKSRKLSKTHGHAKCWKRSCSLPEESRVAEIEWRRVVYNSRRKPSVFVEASSYDNDDAIVMLR